MVDRARKADRWRQAILDFSQDLDVVLMDNVVMAMYTGAGDDQRMAQQVLAQFQEHPDAWQRVPQILQLSSNSQTKVCGPCGAAPR